MNKIKTLTEIQNETGLSKTIIKSLLVDCNEECDILEECVNELRKYMAECIKELNKVARINLRNAILRRLEFLEWRYKD